MTACTPASKKNTKNKKTAFGGLSLYRQNQTVYLVTLLSFFQLVKFAGFFLKNVHDYVEIVDGNPSAFRNAFFPSGKNSLLFHFGFEIVENRLDLRRVFAAGDYKSVGDVAQPFDVDYGNVGRPFVGHRFAHIVNQFFVFHFSPWRVFCNI